MIRTKDLVSFVCREQVRGYAYTGVGQEYIEEIIKRLRAYDELCHDLKQLIARHGKIGAKKGE